MTLRTVVDITRIISRLCEMRKSWYEFGFMSFMCMSVRQFGWLAICIENMWMFIDNACGWLLFSYMVYVCEFSYIWCMSLLDSHIYGVCHLWILKHMMHVICGFSNIWCMSFVDSHMRTILFMWWRIFYMWFFVLSYTWRERNLEPHLASGRVNFRELAENWWKLLCNFCECAGWRKLWIFALTSMSCPGPTEVS
jgi:hypothetical protein